MLDENELHERFPWTASLVFNTEMKKGGFSEKHVPSDSYLVGSKKTKVVMADEAVANKAAAAAKAIKDECEADLAVAMPALNAAISALNTLKPADISNLKAFSNPPDLVRTVLESVCIMKGIKPERKPGPDGKMMEDFWGPAKVNFNLTMKLSEV